MVINYSQTTVMLKKNKIKANRILFCFIAIVYLLRTNISEVLNIDWLFLPGLG